MPAAKPFYSMLEGIFGYHILHCIWIASTTFHISSTFFNINWYCCNNFTTCYDIIQDKKKSKHPRKDTCSVSSILSIIMQILLSAVLLRPVCNRVSCLRLHAGDSSPELLKLVGRTECNPSTFLPNRHIEVT